MASLITDAQNLLKSTAEFSAALAVFSVSQGGKLFKYLPTSEPTAATIESFDETTATMKEQFDSFDNGAFNTVNGVQQAAIDLTFAFLSPTNFSPKTIVQNAQNVVGLAIGQATQLIPGGKVGVGGPPVGWGPVNADDAARLNYGD